MGLGGEDVFYRQIAGKLLEVEKYMISSFTRMEI